MAGREISNDLIERKSGALAQMLDTGDGVRAANILRNEAQELSPHSFNKLAHRTSDKEEKSTRGQGFDLEIVRDGTLIVTGGRKGETLAGHLKDERVGYPDRDYDRGHNRPQPRTEQVVCPKSEIVDDSLKGAGLGAVLGAVLGHKKSDMVKGTVIGAVGGAIYGNEQDKNADCVIVDDNRGRRR